MPTSSDFDDPDFTEHLDTVAEALLDGEVVPLLGAGANLCDRLPGGCWEPGKNLPSGRELSLWLADEFKCKLSEHDRGDLIRVSQYASLTRGERALHKCLDEIFLGTYPVTALHRLLAEVPGRMRERGGRGPTGQLIVSTNYDDLLESALGDAGVEFDLVSYLANGKNAGRFLHRSPDGSERVIARPNRYVDIDPDERTVVMKIHGTIIREHRRQDSYVITEDHYIEFLSRSKPSDLIPAPLLDKLVNSNFLFLGYGLRDWNLRVLLHQILELRAGIDIPSWAVQHIVDRLDQMLWNKNQVTLHERPLSEYVQGLRAALDGAMI